MRQEMREEMSQRRIRVDFHSHTCYSHDATTRPEELVERARERGLERIVVSDHGEIEGALRAHELDPERVIVGEEIRCRCLTELIGLYQKERIPSGLPLEEVVERLREQGALIYAPHPYAYPTRGAWHAERALDVADLVEGFNSRAFWSRWNERAQAEARRRGIPLAAGSDSHFPWEIGRAYAEMPPFFDAPSLREASRHSVPRLEVQGSPWLHVASVGLAIPRVAWRRLSPPFWRQGSERGSLPLAGSPEGSPS